MITELGKPSLCPLLPIVPSLRRSSPHQLVLICLAAVKALAAPMASLWTHFYSLFWLKLTVFFWPLFNDFFFLFGVSLGFWSCSVCPCGCFHSKPPPSSKSPPTHLQPCPTSQFNLLDQPLVSLTDISVPQSTGSLGRNQKTKAKNSRSNHLLCCLFIYLFFFLNFPVSFLFSRPYLWCADTAEVKQNPVRCLFTQ